jgi:hypothetical protein
MELFASYVQPSTKQIIPRDWIAGQLDFECKMCVTSLYCAGSPLQTTIRAVTSEDPYPICLTLYSANPTVQSKLMPTTTSKHKQQTGQQVGFIPMNINCIVLTAQMYNKVHTG